MAFVGHPTIGTSFVLLEEGIVPKSGGHFVLEEKLGPVPVRVEVGRYVTPVAQATMTL